MVRAAVMTAVGAPLRIVDVDLPAPGPGQVEVEVAASGVCHSDLSARAGKMGWAPPMVLGHEGAGVVTAVGEGVERVAVGDHVILAWNQPCRACRACRRGEPYLCGQATADVLASPVPLLDGERIVPFLGAGTFAERTLVLDRAVVPIPSDIPLETAALVGCAASTGVGAVRNTARIHPGSSVAVIGCGAVGLCVIQGARAAGATTIVAVDVRTDKLDVARTLGATHTVDATAEDPVRAIRAATDGGADAVFEVLGRSDTIRQAYDASRRGGMAVVVGVGAVDDEVTFNAMELFWQARTLIGCVYGSADPDEDFRRILDMEAAGHIDLGALITDHVTLDGVDGALDRMAAHRRDVLRRYQRRRRSSSTASDALRAAISTGSHTGANGGA
jgi:S-(hydroxymethyl)glutathione dehydrogenase / alcohol dehydrogenase